MYRGQALTEVGETTWKCDSQDKLVETLLKGAAGHSDGATKTTCSFKSAIPKKGLEADFITICIEKLTIELRFRIANMILSAKGRIINWQAGTSVNNPNSFEVEFEGGRPKKQVVL